MSEQPQTEAGRALWFDMTANSGGEALHPLWVEHLRGRIRAIEREAVAAYLASPQAVEDFALARHRRFRHRSKLGGGRCRCWGEAVGELAALRDLRGAS